MARRASTLIEPELDPLEEVVRDDEFATATDLSEVLAQMRGYDAGAIKGILYRVPNGGGKYENIETIRPPFNMDVLIEDLRERFGGGDFQLRLMVEGKPGVRKVVNFSIAKERTPLIADKKEDGSLTMMMFQMMMKQSEDASRQRADDMRDRQAASERQTAMIVGLATAALPLLVGGKDKTSEVMAALAPFMVKNDDSMEKTLTMLTTAKTLFGNPSEKEGDDVSELVTSGLRVAGPAMKALGDMFTRGRTQAPPQAGTAADGGEIGEQPSLMLGAPEPAPVIGAPTLRPPSKYPVIDLIRDDVLYCFNRNHDPEKAADLVYDTIDAHEVPESEINALVFAFSGSPDWLADLAAEGIELRSRPEWAEQFLKALVAIHLDQDDGERADVDAEVDDTGRGSGGLDDAAENGGLGAEGV